MATAALGGLGAASFSVRGQEPSFHLGLEGPVLPWVLWRGIAYRWGLQGWSLGPTSKRMLTSEPNLRLRREAIAVGCPGSHVIA
jgi:hypothetical protein